jgi:hypothetical protein
MFTIIYSTWVVAMANIITGSCCCGYVTFTLEDCFSDFHFCPCEQYRKLTGTAHSSNLFTSPENINWVNGTDKIKRYDHRKCFFSKAFCENCGSGLPFLSKSCKSLIVPADSLSEERSKKLDAQIFDSEQTKRNKSSSTVAKVSCFLNPI